MMRISNEMLASLAVLDTNNDLSNLFNTQQQLSTGKRVNLPSDDPIAFAQIFNFQSQSNQVNGFLGNVGSAQSVLQITQSSLQSISSILQQAGSLYAEGSNDALSTTDRQNIVAQLNQLIQQAVGVANTTFAGNYIFGGTNTQTQPFVLNGNPPASVTYQGNGTFAQIQISVSQSITTNIPGNEAFLGGANPFNNIFQTLINLRNSFQNTERLSLMPINNPPANVTPGAIINTQSGNYATKPVGAGANSFTVNGVTINYDTSVDSINSIVARINAAGANVNAVENLDTFGNVVGISIQSTNGKLVKLQDVTGNFTSFMQLQDNLTQIQGAQQLLTADEGTVGSALQQLTQVQSGLQSQSVSLTQSISNLQDANIPKEITNLSLQQTSLQAALQTGAKILQQTNLFNFLQ